MEELLKAVKNIQFGKASGLDEIPAEVWKIDSTKYCWISATMYIIKIP